MDREASKALDVSRNNGAKTGRGSPPVETQFRAGNPGRPKGSKNKFTEDFWRDLHEAWAESGKSVITRVIQEDPAKFLAVAANMLPKEVEVTSQRFVVIVPAQAESVDEWLTQNRVMTATALQ
jgi:hypothetical protein